jgi:predicted esterase YcpF (UPF0227 family)
MKEKKLLYLHGFNSSPQSYKAQAMRAYMRDHHCDQRLLCPQLPTSPADAQSFLDALVMEALVDVELAYVGSSLGGYYATYLAEKYDGIAVLINPSVKPYETLEQCLGDNRFYHSDQHWVFDRTHIEQLRAMDISQLSNLSRYMVLLQTGDETLDYREAEQRYAGARMLIQQGGNHAFMGFENHIDDILSFCQIKCD